MIPRPKPKTATRPARQRLGGSIAQALVSIRSKDHFESVKPTHTGIAYRREPRRGIAPLADVWLPESPNGSSLLIIHGGGFLIGSRSMKPVRFLANRLTAAGIAVCSIDYRMIFRGGRLDEATDDVASAMGWWTGTCNGYGLDASRVSALGISAGGALGLLAASDPRAAGVSRLALLFSVYDFTYLGGPLASRVPVWLTGSQDASVWADRSPLNAVQPSIETLVIHGGQDGIVPFRQAERLVAKRLAADLPTRTLYFDDQPHAFLNWQCDAAETTAQTLAGFVRGDA